MEQLLMIKRGLPSSLTDIEGLRRFITFKIANSEIGGNCRISMDQKPGSSVPCRCSTINRMEVLCKSCYLAWCD